MFKAFVLVRNLRSNVERLEFGEFTLNRIGLRFRHMREVFSSVDVNQGDWIFEKSYLQLPLGAPGSPVGGIPNDIEDILLLLRLFQPGDICFVKQTIIPPSGDKLVQFPYRSMNDLNSYSPLEFKVDPNQCEQWTAFSLRMREGRSWRSDWFAAARRFFLSGGAKPFNPEWNDVDRIVDYTTALESALVPEKDYNRRRISHRAAALIQPSGLGDADDVARFMKKVYDIRSQIVHGSRLSDEDINWLSENSGNIELRVRQLLAGAVRELPPGEKERRAALAGLYDPTDDDRGSFAFEKFKEIKTSEVRKTICGKDCVLGRQMNPGNSTAHTY